VSAAATPIKGLFAYPSQPVQLGRTIVSTIEAINRNGRLALSAWERVDNWGKPLIEPILGTISEYDLLIADISKLNFNVTFEVGFAIGSRKRVLLVLNRSLETDEKQFKEIGIYDTLG
jgi:hypothetical protein